VATGWSRQERKHQAGKRPLESVEHTLVQKGQETDGRLNWLYEQIAQLNEIDRALMLLLLDGFSYQEMSGILGISESNVGIKIHRIKKHLTQKSEEITHHGV
jgi:RNA polymerase sigma-70 factor (ECF subfamily)